MEIIGINHDEITGSYHVFYRTESGWKSYFSVYTGYKIRDAYIMHSKQMTWDEYKELPEKI